MNVLSCLPLRFQKEARAIDWTAVRELRLRAGRPMTAECAGERFTGREIAEASDAAAFAEALTGHALQSMAAQTAEGYVSLAGGHRLGLCGTFAGGRLRDITSVCLRFSHEIKQAGESVYRQLKEGGAPQSALIVGAPGTGKTTLLRDLVRRFSESGLNVAVADERGEICGGTDAGPNTDWAAGMSKGAALIMLARTMAPDMLAADEIGARDEIEAALYAYSLGLPLLLTAHGKDAGDIKRRGLDRLVMSGAVRRMVILPQRGQAEVYDAEDYLCSNP